MKFSYLLEKYNKIMAMLLVFVLLMTAVPAGTFAMIVTQTPSLLNTFLSGLDPTGDLTISKEVTHPFGSGYVIPDNISFDFSVSLGEDYAGKKIATSQGEKEADANGNITVSVKPGEAICVEDILTGTSVTVTETRMGSGFAVNGENPKTVTIQRGNNSAAFVNNYTPGPVDPVNISISGTKVLEGRDWQVGDSFSFLLEYKLAGDNTQWQELGSTSVTYEENEVPDPADPGKTITAAVPDFDKFSFADLVQNFKLQYARCVFLPCFGKRRHYRRRYI